MIPNQCGEDIKRSFHTLTQFYMGLTIFGDYIASISTKKCFKAGSYGVTGTGTGAYYAP